MTDGWSDYLTAKIVEGSQCVFLQIVSRQLVTNQKTETFVDHTNSDMHFLGRTSSSTRTRLDIGEEERVVTIT